MVLSTEKGLTVLESLLARAAHGRLDDFARFYDRTSGYAFAVAMNHARARGLQGEQARAAAEDETHARYVEAWVRAGDQPESGLSPLAWLLSLPVPQARVELATFRLGGGCSIH